MAAELLTIVTRIFLTFALSFIFGIQRQKANKPIGFGTYIFVAVGSCSLAITAVHFGTESPLPLLGAIVTGIGFLGAGALIKTGEKITGFMNAASIWVFAIVGLTIGVGDYAIGLTTYSLIWFVFAFDKYLEEKGIGSYQRKFTITTNKVITEQEVREHLARYAKKHKTISVDIDKKNNKVSISYLVEGTKDNINRLAQTLYKESWFDSCKVE